VRAAGLTPGERQLCILLAARQLATAADEEGDLYYLLDDKIHAQLVESLAAPAVPLRASSVAAAPLTAF
jgi:hypothetical protein